MAFPFLVDETFDDGTRGNFDAETDASSILDFPDYRELARTDLAPWRGAHALRLTLNGTAIANITETGGFDTSQGGTIHVWFPLCVGKDLTLTSGDAVIVFALQSAGPVNEVVFGIRNNGGTYELFAGETGATRTFPIVRSDRTWYEIELSCTIGNPNDGTIDFFVDGGAVGAQITALSQAAITQGMLGAISGTAANNAGTILIGGIVADDARLYPRQRFPQETFWVTRDMCAFVGPGRIENATLTGTSTDAVMTILDTDSYSATGTQFSHEPRVYVRNTTASADAPQGHIGPIDFVNGAYVILTGTNPQCMISVAEEGNGYVKSGENYRARGLRR